MLHVDLDGADVRFTEPQAGAAVGAELTPQVAAGGGEQRVAGAALAAGAGLELAHFLERVDPHLRVGAERQPHAGVTIGEGGEVAVAEASLGGGAGDDDRP